MADEAYDFMKDPKYNLDLIISTTAKVVSSASTATTSETTSPATSTGFIQIPLSTIVYRGAEEMTGKTAAEAIKSKSFDFNPILLKLRDEFDSIIAKFLSLDKLGAQITKATWWISLWVTAFVTVSVLWAVYVAYTTNAPVIGVPSPIMPAPPTPPEDSTPGHSNTLEEDKGARVRPHKADVRIKLFSELLTGYLTVILSVTIFMGDSLVLKYLLGGLTGFIGLVALVLPDEAEWSCDLYNWEQNGMELKSMIIDAPAREVAREVTEVTEAVKKRFNADEILADTKETIKEIREKVVERFEESRIVKKGKEVLDKVKKEDVVVESQEVSPRRVEEAAALPLPESPAPVVPTNLSSQKDPVIERMSRRMSGASDDLKAQIERVTDSLKEKLDPENSIGKASKKVEEWLAKAGDSVIPEDEHIEALEQGELAKRPTSPPPNPTNVEAESSSKPTQA